jgi:hypothetical protein
MKFLSILLLVYFLPTRLFPQQRIVFNGAILTISNGAVLVVDNPAPDALTVVSSGGISSEDPNNNLVWNIGEQAARYQVPFISSGTSIPVLFTTSGAAGNGRFILSTYAGSNWQNSNYLPPTVTNVNMNGTDNSNHVIDRFWQINPAGYTIQPTLSDVKLSYKENEWEESGNSISEPTLVAQNWDNVSGSWLNPPMGIDDPAGNQLNITSINQTALYPWWTLVSDDFPLPLTLLSFTLERYNESALLKWTVTDEINTRFFEVQRSIDGLNFVPLGSVASGGTSNVTRNYSYLDPLNGISQGFVYYRLRFVDEDGKFSFSPIRELAVDGSDQSLVAISPNPASSLIILRFGDVKEGLYDMQIFNAEGRQIKTRQMAVTQHSAFYIFRLPDMTAGSYFIKISGQGMSRSFTILFN